jgi:hypothetical protein
MKKILHITLIGLFTIALFGCSHEQDVQPEKQQIQFTFQVASSDNAGGRTNTTLPDGAHLQITVVNKSGSAVLTNHKVNLLKVGDSYMTEPIELKPGSYSLTDFLIIQDANVLFATPKKNSTLAPAVSHPLPYSFSIGKNKVSNVGMQVVDVTKRTPEEFGYASFHVDVVNPIQIAVFTMQRGNLSFTEANVHILTTDNHAVSYHVLEPKTNVISFKGDPTKTYKLLVSQSTYELYSREFTYNELMEELDGKPLKITLKPQVTLNLKIGYEDPETPFYLELGGEGSVTITGPAGLSGTFTLPVSFEETTIPEGEYSIHISGDVDKITSFSSFGYNSGITTISGLMHMRALRSFDPGWYFNDAIDLILHTKLEEVVLSYVLLPEWLRLPENHFIKTFVVQLAGETITQEQMDYAVNNIYENAVNRNIQNGFISFLEHEPISASTLEKLRTLRDDYGWSVSVDVEI